MPEYPYVYAEGPARRVEPGGTRVRVLRRRRPAEEPAPEARAGEAWEALLREAIEELNAAFRQTGAPFTCTLLADDAGFLLHVRRAGEGPAGAADEAVDEVLEPSDLPAWLRRLRTRLGLLVDETI